MSSPDNRVTLWMRVILPLLTAMATAQSGAEERASRPTPNVEVALEVVLDAAEPTLAFTVKNVDNEPVRLGAFAVATNGVVIVGPDGRVTGNHGRTGANNMLAPGARHTWEVTLRDLFREDPDLREPGTYRLYWEFGEARTRPIRVLRKAGVADAGNRAPAANAVAFHQSTPKAALDFFYAGLSGLRIDFMRVIASDPADQGQVRTAQVLKDQGWAVQGMREIAVRRFGADAVGDWDPNDYAGAKRDVDAASLELADDLSEARVVFPQWSARVVRSGQLWRVSVTNFMGKGEPHPELVRRTGIFTRMRANLEEGKYATFGEFTRALMAELNAPAAALRKPK